MLKFFSRFATSVFRIIDLFSFSNSSTPVIRSCLLMSVERKGSENHPFQKPYPILTKIESLSILISQGSRHFTTPLKECESYITFNGGTPSALLGNLKQILHHLCDKIMWKQFWTHLSLDFISIKFTFRQIHSPFTSQSLYAAILIIENMYHQVY